MNMSLSDLCRKHRTDPVLPEPHRLVANTDATFEQQILNLPKGQRIADVHHHYEA
jgi:hypothetical protein